MVLHLVPRQEVDLFGRDAVFTLLVQFEQGGAGLVAG